MADRADLTDLRIRPLEIMWESSKWTIFRGDFLENSGREKCKKHNLDYFLLDKHPNRICRKSHEQVLKKTRR